MLEASPLALDRERGRTAQSIVRVHKTVATTLDHCAGAARKTAARLVEPGDEFGRIGDDEPRGRGRGRRAGIRGVVAERVVLFVTDSGNDRYRARRDRAHELFVAEREQV